MWIFLGIILFILLLITIILLLPFSFIIKTDEDGDLTILYKILNKTFGENPDPNQPIIKALKNISGVTRLDVKNVKKGTRENGLLAVIRENLSLIIKLISELLKIFKSCTVKVLKIDIVCAEENAADTAISYGVCYAIVSPLLNLVHNKMKVRKKGESVNISADFNSKNDSFKLELILVTRVYKLIIALFRLVKDETQRIYAERSKEAMKKSQK